MNRSASYRTLLILTACLLTFASCQTTPPDLATPGNVLICPVRPTDAELRALGTPAGPTQDRIVAWVACGCGWVKSRSCGAFQ